MYPDSGILSSTFSPARSGIDARLGLANAAGGVNGRKIVYDWRDDQGTPDGNSQAAHDLVDRVGVFGIIESTIAAAGGAPYLAQKGVPVTGLAAEPIWSTMRNMFSFSYTTGAAVDTYGKFVKDHGGNRAVILQTALSTGVSERGEKLARSMESAGVDYVGAVSYTPGADSPASVAARIVATGADTMISNTDSSALAQVLNALRASGHPLKIAMATSGYDIQVLRHSNGGLAGVIVPVFYRPFEAGGPAIANYIKAMAEYSPQVEQPQADFPLMSFIQTDMFIKGLELAGPCPTRKSFIDGLRTVTSYNAGGLIEPIDIKNGLGRETTCYSFVQANPTATAFDVVEPSLCGHALP